MSTYLYFRDETEEEPETPVPDEKSGESVDSVDNSSEDSNEFSNEVEENQSRPLIEVETRSSDGLEASDSEEHVECKRENHPDIALADDIEDEPEDHKMLETIETVQDEAQESPSHQPENSEIAVELFGVELLEEPVKEGENITLETEVKDEDILEMNIKVCEAIDNNFEAENEPILLTDLGKESYPECDEPVGISESDEPEYFPNLPKNQLEELLDVTEIAEPSEDSVTEAHIADTHVESVDLEIALKMEENTDDPGVAVESDIDDTEITNEPVTEVYNRNAETVMENEEVLEMNIKVEESTTKHSDSEKEILLTLVYNDQEKEGNHASVNSNESTEEITDVQDVPSIDELEKNEESYELLKNATEFDPLKETVAEFDNVDVLRGVENLEDVKEEDMITHEEHMSETNQEETEAKEPGTIISVAFIPTTLDEPIEFIDSETLEMTQNKVEQPIESSEKLEEEASFPLNEENVIADGKPPTQLEELKIELVPVIPPRPLQSQGASSPHLVAGLEDNAELRRAASADSIKSPEKVSGRRKPEWMRKSLVRKGSVRRLFSRMRSKRFSHDRLETPPPQPTAPQRPLRQIIVDFLLLLFES